MGRHRRWRSGHRWAPLTLFLDISNAYPRSGRPAEPAPGRPAGKVKAVSGFRMADIYVKGTYDGPTDIVANEDYQLLWTADSGRLLETGGGSYTQ